MAPVTAFGLPTSEELREAMARYPPLWVIYSRTVHFPDNVTCRVWFGPVQGSELYVARTLDEMRDYILENTAACFWLGRKADDDPTILEVWV